MSDSNYSNRHEESSNNQKSWFLRSPLGFTALTAIYAGVIAGAVYVSSSLAHLPIEVRVGNTNVNNKKGIASIDSIFGCPMQPSQKITVIGDVIIINGKSKTIIVDGTTYQIAPDYRFKGRQQQDQD